jgi:hypothetical protein
MVVFILRDHAKEAAVAEVGKQVYALLPLLCQDLRYRQACRTKMPAQLKKGIVFLQVGVESPDSGRGGGGQPVILPWGAGSLQGFDREGFFPRPFFK